MIRQSLDEQLSDRTRTGRLSMKGSIWAAAMIGLLVVVAPSLYAQNVEQSPPWKGNLEMSFLQTSGNTDSETFLLAGKVERAFSRSKLTGEGRTIYSQKGGETSDKNWILKLKYDRSINERFYAFLSEVVERDTLKGIKIRYMTQVGLGYDFIKTASDMLKGEVSAGYIRENPVDPFPDRGYPTGRIFGEYDHSFTDTSRISQTVEWIPNLKQGRDYLINEETALITNLMGNFALKISYSIAYDNQPPPGFKTTDRLFKTSILYTF
jgi:putative salt-induced outer membrane protein